MQKQVTSKQGTFTEAQVKAMIDAALKAQEGGAKARKPSKPAHVPWGMAPTGSGAIWRFSANGRCMGAHKLETWLEIFENNPPQSFKDFTKGMK